MISEKDRSQLLRMAGNILPAIYSENTKVHPRERSSLEEIVVIAAMMAHKTMQAVDKIISMENSK